MEVEGESPPSSTWGQTHIWGKNFSADFQTLHFLNRLPPKAPLSIVKKRVLHMINPKGIYLTNIAKDLWMEFLGAFLRYQSFFVTFLPIFFCWAPFAAR